MDGRQAGNDLARLSLIIQLQNDDNHVSDCGQQRKDHEGHLPRKVSHYLPWPRYILRLGERFVRPVDVRLRRPLPILVRLGLPLTN